MIAAPPITRAVDPGNRHHADIFTVGSVGRRTEEAGNDRRQAVGKHRTMQARVADQIALNDIGGHHQMPHVLGNHHQRGGQYGEDSKPLKARSVESRQREPMRLGDRGGIDHAHHKRQRIAHQHADQDRDNRRSRGTARIRTPSPPGHHRDNNGFTVR